MLFNGPLDRIIEQFCQDVNKNGWLVFRDADVNWEYVRALPSGEMVSTAGTHLGHNKPDKKGNKYIINLCAVAGKPVFDDDL